MPEPDDEQTRELGNRLRKLQEAAEDVEAKGEVPLEDLLPPEFMEQHTEFDTAGAFFEEAGWRIEKRTALDAIPRDEIDRHVRDHTDFPSWDAMQSQARTEYIKRTLRQR